MKAQTRPAIRIWHCALWVHFSFAYDAGMISVDPASAHQLDAAPNASLKRRLHFSYSKGNLRSAFVL
jgi:hypothetical protein